MTITRDQVLDTLRAQLANGPADINALAESVGATPKVVRLHLLRMRAAGVVTYETRDMATLAIVGEKRARAPKAAQAKTPPPKTIAEVAEKHSDQPAAPAPVDRWTGAEMRELLDVPHRAVTLVRRALTTPWGPPLLDAIGSLVEESEAVPVARVVAPSAPRIARAPKAKPAPVEEEPRLSTRAPRGPFRVVDADGDVVRTCRTLSAAKAALADDDADHVLDADDQIVARGGVDEDEEDDDG